MKIVVNKCFGGYSLSKEAYEFLGLEWDEFGYKFENDRTNKDLIRCVEALGDKANGRFADLEIVEVPENIDFYIDEYDGIETVHEEHRSW